MLKKKELRTSKLKKNMRDFRMSWSVKEKKRSVRENKKSKQLWPLLLILSSKIRNNRSKLKTTRWCAIYKISFERKSKKKKEEKRWGRSRKNKCVITWVGRWKKKGRNRLRRKKLMRSKQLFGKRTRTHSLIMRNKSKNTWRESIRSTKMCC